MPSDFGDDETTETEVFARNFDRFSIVLMFGASQNGKANESQI